MIFEKLTFERLWSLRKKYPQYIFSLFRDIIESNVHHVHANYLITNVMKEFAILVKKPEKDVKILDIMI